MAEPRIARTVCAGRLRCGQFVMSAALLKKASKQIEADGEATRRQKEGAGIVPACRRPLCIRKRQRERMPAQSLFNAETDGGFRAIFEAQDAGEVLVEDGFDIAEFESNARRVFEKQ